MTTNILLTGGEGMIGSRLSKYLEDREYNVVELEGDVTDWNSWAMHLDKKYHFVIHLAALAGVRDSFKYPEKYYHANVNGTKNAFAYANMCANRVLYASSSNAYEWWGNPYAATKKMNEVQAAENSIPSIGMRFHTVWPGREDMLFRKLQNKKVIYVNSGHQRDFIHVEDLLRAITLLLQNFDLVYNKQKVVDIGTGEATWVSDVAIRMGYNGPLVHENPEGERIHTQANIEWLKDLGWEPRRNILNEEDHVDVPQRRRILQESSSTT